MRARSRKAPETRHVERPAPRIHAVVISWEGKGPEAQRIAAALAPQVDRLTVIYSNLSARSETGAGTWARVPQDWYYGRKFAEALRCHDDEDVLLLVQADAGSDDWPTVVARLREAFSSMPDLGIWAPDLHVSPYPSDVATLRHARGTHYHVAQTDGIVWALSRPVAARLGTFDYDANNLGWGIDWAAIGIARAAGLSIIRDAGVLVSHPQSRGYSESRADIEMDRFLDQLTPDERAEADFCRHIVAARKHRGVGAARWPMMVHEGPQRLDPGPLADAIAQVWSSRGRVFVEGARDLETRGAAVEVDGACHPLRPLDADPSAIEVPLALKLEPSATATYRVQVNGLGRDQMAGLDTARIEILAPDRPVRVPLGPPVAFPPGMEGSQIGVGLAARGTHGTLVLRWEDGRTEGDVRLPLYPNVMGGDGVTGWQEQNLANMPGAHGPRRASLWLDYAGEPGPGGRPPVYFVALPHVVRLTERPDLVWPARARGARTGPSRWYRADPGPIRAGSVASLVLGSDRHALFAARPGMEARRDGGKLIVAEGGEMPPVCVLWIDGDPAFVVDHGGGAVGVAVPTRAGTESAVELRDASGSRIYWTSERKDGPFGHLVRACRRRIGAVARRLGKGA